MVSPAGGGPDEIAAAVARLRAQFPGVSVWFGIHTWHWWAMVECGGWRLVEALTPDELAEAIPKAAAWPWPRS